MTAPMRRLGSGLRTAAVGYGAMVLTGIYGAVGRDEGRRVLDTVLDRGPVLIDTADSYGGGRNERLVGDAVRHRRADAVIATKWGVAEPGGPGRSLPTSYDHDLRVDARPARAPGALDASLARLDVERIDLWSLHFPDPAVPIEDTVGAMAAQVAAGKVAHLGLSNVDADQVRRAAAVHPIAAVQIEWSLWSRQAEAELVPTLIELDIGIVAWGPLGNGVLAGPVTLAEHDFRRCQPRFQGPNLAANTARFAPLAGRAAHLGVTPAELALAWLLARHPSVVPIPGTRSPPRAARNAGAAALELAPAVLAELDRTFPPGAALGAGLFG